MNECVLQGDRQPLEPHDQGGDRTQPRLGPRDSTARLGEAIEIADGGTLPRV